MYAKTINQAKAFSLLRLSFSKITLLDVLVFLEVAFNHEITFSNLYSRLSQKTSMSSEQLQHSLNKLLGNSSAANSQRFSLIIHSAGQGSRYSLSPLGAEWVRYFMAIQA